MVFDLAAILQFLVMVGGTILTVGSGVLLVVTVLFAIISVYLLVRPDSIHRP